MVLGRRVAAHLALRRAVVGDKLALQRAEVLDVVEEFHAFLVDTRRDGGGSATLRSRSGSQNGCQIKTCARTCRRRRHLLWGLGFRV